MAWSHGSFWWNELMTHDVAKAKAFYQKTAGWTFESMAMPNGTYWLAKSGDTMVGGIFEMAGPDFEKVPDHWLSYIAVDDVDASYAKAVKDGAQAMRPPFDVQGVGRITILKAPGGAPIGFATPANR